eukprot:363107-Pelagomonas_calceolata.AAC.1
MDGMPCHAAGRAAKQQPCKAQHQIISRKLPNKVRMVSGLKDSSLPNASATMLTKLGHASAHLSILVRCAWDNECAPEHMHLHVLMRMEEPMYMCARARASACPNACAWKNQ